MNVYDFEALDINGEKTRLKRYEGKALLIVNTASACGFTPQYQGLRKLHEEYKGRLEVLAFPCNQFGSQEPGSEQEIKDFCDLRFNISFPLFSKVNVNGKDAHPLFVWLKKELPGALGTQKIKWNFTKFLLDSQGRPVKRYAPNTSPEKIAKEIPQALA